MLDVDTVTGDRQMRALTGLNVRDIIAAMPQLRPVVEPSGAGHWLQQERPAGVTAALPGFRAACHFNRLAVLGRLAAL